LNLVIKHGIAPNPFIQPMEFYVLIETNGSKKEHDDEKLEIFLEKVMEKELVMDGVLAQDNSQQSLFWSIREGISEACSKEGGMFKYDLSVPLNDLYSIVTDMKKRLEDVGIYKADGKGSVKHIVGFGHMGDGNLHLNIMTTGRTNEIKSAIEPFVYEVTSKLEGSISAEHGVGQMKSNYLGYSKSKDFIEIMKQVKKLFDPNEILNPYKYFPNK
jgi:D-lactate dehydrogenase (cytochrome)